MTVLRPVKGSSVPPMDPFTIFLASQGCKISSTRGIRGRELSLRLEDAMAKELVNDSALQRLYQSVLEENENGVEVEIKMQATKEFRAKLNDLVFEAISFSISHARRAGHQMLTIEDLPMLVEATECTSALEDDPTEDAATT
jgi:hypothetical protein